MNRLLRAAVGMAFTAFQRDTGCMFIKAACLLLGVVVFLSGAGPEYTSDGQMKAPEHYREWVYLTSGFDMSYSPADQTGDGHHMFDNVFVNPEAYKVFVQTGTWPDKQSGWPERCWPACPPAR